MMREIVTSLSIRYDDCRRPRWGAPAAVLVNENKKNPCPAVPRRGPEAGVHQVEYDFHGSDVKSLYSVTMPEIVTLLFIRYDNCHRLRWGAPAAVLVNENKKTQCPAVPRGGPEVGVHRIPCDFYKSGINQNCYRIFNCR